MNAWRATGLAAGCLASVLIAAPSAEACSCAGIRMGPAFRQNDAAIVGRLVGARPAEPSAVRGRRTDYVYRVRRVYKGEARIDEGQRLAVRSARYGASCGLPRHRHALGLFLERRRRHWHSNLCWTVPAERMRRAGEARGEALALRTCGRERTAPVGLFGALLGAIRAVI